MNQRKGRTDSLEGAAPVADDVDQSEVMAIWAVSARPIAQYRDWIAATPTRTDEAFDKAGLASSGRLENPRMSRDLVADAAPGLVVAQDNALLVIRVVISSLHRKGPARGDDVGHRIAGRRRRRVR